MSKYYRPWPDGTRREVYNKTNGRCAYCGDNLGYDKFHIEHATPKCSGGGNELNNLLPSCYPCNARKKAKDIDQFRYWVAEGLADKDLERIRERIYDCISYLETDEANLIFRKLDELEVLLREAKVTFWIDQI